MPPKRNPEIYLDDMRMACSQIVLYSKDMEQEAFEKDQKTIDAVVRNFEILGEAARKVPENVRDQKPDIPWREVVEMRNLLIHEYFGVDLKILWKTVQDDIPLLLESLGMTKS